MSSGRRAAIGCLAGVALLFAGAATGVPPRPLKKGEGKARVVFELPKTVGKKAAPKPRRRYAEAGPGATVRSGNSQATLHLGRVLTLRLRERAVVRFRKLLLNPKTQRLETYIQIVQGKVLFKVRRLRATRSTVRIRTRACVAAVRGTVFVIDAENPAKTNVEVLEGELATYSAAGLAEDQEPPTDVLPINVAAGKELDYDAEGASGMPEPIEPEELAREKAWAKEPEPPEPDEKGETGEEGEGATPVPEKEGKGAPEKPAAEEGDETPGKPKQESAEPTPGEKPGKEGEPPGVEPAENAEKPEEAVPDEEPAVIEPLPAEGETPEPSGEDPPEKGGSEEAD